MFIETMKITSAPAMVGDKIAGNAKQLRKPRVTDDGRLRVMIGEPCWNSVPEDGDTYFGTPHSLNTKFVANATDHPVIGAIVEMSNGKTYHLDVTASQIRIEGNRR
jgi:hypothetical protein